MAATARAIWLCPCARYWQTVGWCSRVPLGCIVVYSLIRSLVGSFIHAFKDHPSARKIAEHFGPTSNFDFQLIEVEYVKGILLKFNPRKAMGCDNISQRLLHITAPAIAQLLTCLINYLITNCSWPTVWKCSMFPPYTRSRKRPIRSTIGQFHY